MFIGCSWASLEQYGTGLSRKYGDSSIIELSVSSFWFPPEPNPPLRSKQEVKYLKSRTFFACLFQTHLKQICLSPMRDLVNMKYCRERGTASCHPVDVWQVIQSCAQGLTSLIAALHGVRGERSGQKENG